MSNFKNFIRVYCLNLEKAMAINISCIVNFYENNEKSSIVVLSSGEQYVIDLTYNNLTDKIMH